MIVPANQACVGSEESRLSERCRGVEGACQKPRPKIAVEKGEVLGTLVGGRSVRSECQKLMHIE